MNKEYLEALETLKTALHNEWLRFYPQFKELNEKTKFVDGVRMVSSDADAFLIVRQALTKYESIKESNPSEALECLENIGNWELANSCMEKVNESDEFATIKQALLKAQREHKALEVIKKKPCNSGLCINYLKANKQYPNMQDYEHYCMTIREYDRVDENEFNILKEWILND